MSGWTIISATHSIPYFTKFKTVLLKNRRRHTTPSLASKYSIRICRAEISVCLILVHLGAAKLLSLLWCHKFDLTVIQKTIKINLNFWFYKIDLTVRIKLHPVSETVLKLIWILPKKIARYIIDSIRAVFLINLFICECIW